MRSLVKKYLRADEGQFGLTFAILSLPLLLAVGVALDSAILYKKSQGLQNALDTSALAAVIAGNMTIEDRKARAQKVFNENFISPGDVKLDVQASATRVDVTATLTKKTVLMGLTGANSVEIIETAAAIRTVEDTICIMTLDPSKSGSLLFEKDAYVNAPACSIQVNSDSSTAIRSSASSRPNAKSICVAGGSQGNLPNEIKGECARVDDPYSHIQAPATSACDYGPISLFSFSSYQEIMYVNEQDKLLKPGVYCDGLHIYDSSVKLAPGTYIIKDGPLTIGHNSTVVGEDVTFVFQGEGSVLYTYEDVKMTLKAPSTGQYAGLLFFQDKYSSIDDTSIIKGGVDMNLVGTMYFPSQSLFIGGVGKMGATSPAMAFIAKNITFTSDIEQIVSLNESNILQLKSMLEFAIGLGGSLGLTDYEVTESVVSLDSGKDANKFETSILTNHREAGLPPILPRSDDGARLLPKGQ